MKMLRASAERKRPEGGSLEATKLRFFNYKTKLFVVFGKQYGLNEEYLRNYNQVNEYPWMIVFKAKTLVGGWEDRAGGGGATLVSSLFRCRSSSLPTLGSYYLQY